MIRIVPGCRPQEPVRLLAVARRQGANHPDTGVVAAGETLAGSDSRQQASERLFSSERIARAFEVATVADYGANPR
jgi:hypothetical protein